MNLFMNKDVPNVDATESLEIAEKTLSGVLYTPSYGYFFLADASDFEFRIENPSNTNPIWCHSLPSIHALLREHKMPSDDRCLVKAGGLINGYFGWLSWQPSFYVAWKDEHAVANRSRFLNTPECCSDPLCRASAAQYAIHAHASQG